MQTEKDKGDISFEESLQKLEDIVKILEKGGLPLEESFALYQKGVELSGICSLNLESIEKKIHAVNTENNKEEVFSAGEKISEQELL